MVSIQKKSFSHWSDAMEKPTAKHPGRAEPKEVPEECMQSHPILLVLFFSNSLKMKHER